MTRIRNRKDRGTQPSGAALETLALTSGALYEKIQQAIFEQRLAPGTQLIEERLVELSGLSRARIRPVLARLAHENLVTLIPNRGAFIASPSESEAQELFFTRRLIEPAVARLLSEQASGVQLGKLKRHVLKEGKARLRRDRAAIIRLSGEFHRLLAELAGNTVLIRILHELTAQTCLVVALYDSPNTAACAHDDHGDIIRAIEAGDGDLAANLMEHHLHVCEQALRLSESIRRPPDLKELLF